MLDFLEQIYLVIISCVFNFSKILMLITASYLSCFIECNYYSSTSRAVLVGVIFSQVNPGIPQQVADLIRRCQIFNTVIGYASIFAQSSVFELFKNVYFAMGWS